MIFFCHIACSLKLNTLLYPDKKVSKISVTKGKLLASSWYLKAMV